MKKGASVIKYLAIVNFLHIIKTRATNNKSRFEAKIPLSKLGMGNWFKKMLAPVNITHKVMVKPNMYK